MTEKNLDIIGKYTKVENDGTCVRVEGVVNNREAFERMMEETGIEFEDNTDLIIAGLQKENEMLRRLVDCYSDGLEEIVMKVHAGALSSDDDIYHEIALIAERAEDIEQSWKDDIDDY